MRKPTCIFRTILAAALLLVSAVRAAAHPVAQGSATARIFADRIEIRLRASTEEALTERMLSEESSDAHGAEDPWIPHGAYLLKHLTVKAGDRLLAGRVDRVTPPGTALTEADGMPEVSNSSVIYDLSFRPQPAQSRISRTDRGTIEIFQDVLNEFEFAAGNRWEATYLFQIGELGRTCMAGCFSHRRSRCASNSIWRAFLRRPETRGRR
jgi:hypothetical protein